MKIDITKEVLIDLLNQRYTNEQLAAYFNCGITTIKRAKLRFDLVGVKTNANPLAKSEEIAAISLIEQGKDTLQVSKILGISDYRLKKWLPKQVYTQMVLNSHAVRSINMLKADITPIFNPTAESAYICGVLQSDGYLTSDGYVGLSVRDKDFCQHFANFFKTNINVTSPITSETFYTAKFKDVRNIEKFKQITNIQPKKTYLNYEIPQWIVNNDEFLKNFIVGVFNGDGWASRAAGRNTCEIGICQHENQRDFLTFLAAYLGWGAYEKSENRFTISTKTIGKVQEFYSWFSECEYAMLRKVLVLESVFG